MKKTIYLIFVMLLSLMFVPVHAATEDIAIESIKMVEHGGIAREVTPASAEGLNVKFDVKFYNKDDFVKYKLIIKNTSKDSYELSDQTNFNKSDYIEYKFEFENDNKVVDPGSEKVMYIVITYKNAVPENLLLEDGGFQEDNAMKISLNNKSAVNPDTGIKTVVIMSIALLVLGMFMALLGYTSTKRLMVLVLSLMVMLPLGVSAVKQITVNLNSKVKIIGEVYSFNYRTYNYETDEETNKTYYFEPGMTLKQWLDSEYNDDNLVIQDGDNSECVLGIYIEKFMLRYTLSVSNNSYFGQYLGYNENLENEVTYDVYNVTSCEAAK